MFAYLDCSSGVSGDKFLGALVDAGLDPDVLRDRLSRLGADGWTLDVERVARGGLAGTLVTVTADEGGPARGLADILGMIAAAGLDPRAGEGATRAFTLLAEAEAAVHGIAVEQVHFHEVGALDSIIDVVGAAIGLAELGIDELQASPVCVGSGTIATSHGELPVPAPATTRLLEGVPVFGGGAPGEMTTPTGAALLRAFATAYGPMPPVVLSRTGAGAGSRDVPGVPNLLRLSLGERYAPEEAASSPADVDVARIVMLETVVDHVTPEDLASALERQLDEGALDAWQQPTVMKKGRLGSAVTVLAAAGDADRLAARLMADTGSLGVRRRETERYVAEREVVRLETSLGEVRVKVAEAAGVELEPRPEHDDVAQVAHRTGLAIADVAARLAEEARALLGRTGSGSGADGGAGESAVTDAGPDAKPAPEAAPPVPD